MVTFEFSKKIVPRVIEEISKAKEFIKIAVFQIHHKSLFDKLLDKLEKGIDVEIFTLPYDSINENVKDEVVSYFKNVISHGAKVHFCKWNVGDPERTTTAVGRWYSFHGKFIVTDKSAIALSANFIQGEELDASLIFEQDTDKISEFVKKFDELKELFICIRGGYDGRIRDDIIKTGVQNPEAIFKLPPVIESETHIKNWIRHYPFALCPMNTEIRDELYIVPFDGRGRNLLYSIIENSSKFVYLSTESFTDSEFPEVLKQTRLRGLNVKVLTGAGSMDFTDRLQKMLRDLLGNEIAVKTTDEEIHSKLIITDKYVAVSSINLNKMNLGFKSLTGFWRENTESITICSDTRIIESAKKQYLEIFNQSIDIEEKLSGKLEGVVGRLFTSTFGLRTWAEVKRLFAKLIVKEEIRVRKLVLDIGRITSKLMGHFNRQMVEKSDFLMSIILYYLSERKHDVDQIKGKLTSIESSIDHIELLNNLMQEGFIEKVDDYYKLKVEKLF